MKDSSNQKPVALSSLALATGIWLSFGQAMAAERIDLQQHSIERLKHRYSSLVSRQGAASMAHTRHEQLLGMDSESRLLLKQRHNDFGKRNTRYTQTFRGIPIFGEQVIVSENAQTGEVEALFGRQIDGLASELPVRTPRMSRTQALELGKQTALGSQLATMMVKDESSEQMIYVDDRDRAHMVYVVSFFADSPRGGTPTRPFLIIDADSGRILKQWEGLQSVQVGTGPGGNQKVGQYEYGTDFGYMDVAQSGSTCIMSNANVATYNLNGGTSTSGRQPYAYNCPRNSHKSINGAYSPLNDAHYFGGVVYDMYQSYMNAAPLSFRLKLGVHYGTNYENAKWTGTEMLFGDGASDFHPLVSLDVLAHEVSHGYTQQNSGLYGVGTQAYGMNESFSDISGEAAEYYMRGSNDFLVGADIRKDSGALRYMCNPTQDGKSIDNAANFYSGMDEHHSSGVYNKAFCTLAKTSGWNTKSAFQAFARANRDYWTSSMSYNQAACGVQRAASDMGMNVQDVVNALLGVGVTATGTNCGGSAGNLAPTANFSSSINGLTVQFSDSSTDSDGSIVSRSWNFGDNSSSSLTNPSKTYAAAGTYTVTLTVTDDDGATHSRTASVAVSSGGGAPCTGCTAYSGNLSGSGDSDVQPNGSYYHSSTSGSHQGWLEGPSGTDFDLRLYKWNGSSWSQVGSSAGSTSSEQVSYNGTAGYYHWKIESYSGNGSYQFWFKRP